MTMSPNRSGGWKQNKNNKKHDDSFGVKIQIVEYKIFVFPSCQVNFQAIYNILFWGLLTMAWRPLWSKTDRINPDQYVW